VDEVKKYIETGILELYVLGDISPDEKLQVEQMIAKHPEVRAELTAIEIAMEDYAQANAIELRPELREKILNSLVTNFADDNTFKTSAPTAKVVAMPVQKNSNFYKYAFAASVALLAVSLVALYNMHSQLQQSNTQLALLNSQNLRYSKTVNLMDKQLGVFRDTSFKVIHLKAVGKVPNIGLNVAFSPARKKVILDMAALNMPKNDQDHQYQLWALVGGKPVDLGVFDKTTIDTTDMKEMKSIGAADAFAVTLEPRGGSINPTMTELMVMGK